MLFIKTLKGRTLKVDHIGAIVDSLTDTNEQRMVDLSWNMRNEIISELNDLANQYGE